MTKTSMDALYQDGATVVSILAITAIILGFPLVGGEVGSVPLATAIGSIAGLGGYRISKNARNN